MSNLKKNNIFEKTSFLGPNNSQFIEQLYADYLETPDKIPIEWKVFFEGLNDKKDEILKTVIGPSWAPRAKKKKFSVNFTDRDTNKKNQDLEILSKSAIADAAKASVRANMLVRAYRIRGHLISNLDPLGLQKREEHPELKAETYGFSENDLNKKIFLDGVLGLQSATLKEIIDIAKKNYCQNIGYEFMHMSDPNEKQWIRDRIEGKEKGIFFTENGKKAILNKLVEAEGFEKFLHIKFVGTKRFGLDGGESLIPALAKINQNEI